MTVQIASEHRSRILPMPMKSPLLAALLLTSNALLCLAQQSEPRADNTAADAVLHAYESCHFADGLQVVQVDALPAGVQERSIETKSGPKTIRMVAGRRIMLAYPMKEFMANIKPELLPADTWGIEKQALLDELDYLLASDHANLPGNSLPATLHGLEIRGFDRAALQGGVLGFYLLFDDARHIATSVYLLNQDPLTRSFQTIEQYHAVRDRLLTNYVGCVAENQALRRGAHEVIR